MTKEDISIWSPLTIGNMELKHRVVHAPMTRNRNTESGKGPYSVPNDLVVEYYDQRATPGGLIISEAISVNLRGSIIPGFPGLFNDEQVQGWAKVNEALHTKGTYSIAQLWHPGRVGPPRFEGEAWGVSDITYEGGAPTVHQMTKAEIEETIQDFVNAAQNAIKAGFDGVEIHAANGYLFDQFHHSNINTRTDEYGGDYKKRSQFTLEVSSRIAGAIGSEKLGVRLAPFGLFNETRGEEREAQWKYLCKELSALKLAYIHLIEPRFDEIRNEQDKIAMMKSSEAQLSLDPYIDLIARPQTKVIVAGGYTWDNCYEGITHDKHDAVAFGRYFTSNFDLVHRLRDNKPLYRYWRDKFYGPFEDNAIGYTYFESQVFADESDRGQPQLA